MSGTALARRAAKLAVLPLGLPGRRPGDLEVLLYHRVGAGGREVDVPRAAFEQQIAALAKRGEVLAIDEALSLESVRGGVVVTIDDGFHDFQEHVLPVLVHYAMPATLYLTTGFVREELGSSATPDHLSWQELAEAVATGLVTVGAHTHTHPDLAFATEQEADAEMRRSKELIEDRLGTPCRHFAYPFSRASAAAECAARKLFYSAALLWGTNRGGRTDLHRIARVPVLRSDGPFFFGAKIRGRLDQERLLYRTLGRGPWRRR